MRVQRDCLLRLASRGWLMSEVNPDAPTSWAVLLQRAYDGCTRIIDLFPFVLLEWLAKCLFMQG